MLQIFLRRVPKDDPHAGEMVSGFKFSFLPSLVGSALAGTTPDFGAGGGAAYGTMMALLSKFHAQNSRRGDC